MASGGVSDGVHLSPLDLSIVAAYLAATVAVGWFASRASSASTRAYFLGGNELPWYVLGVSNASGMFDVAGTMWMVYTMYVYGLKSVWLPWLWPVFNQIFLAAYLSQWLRRSGVMTGAEWMTFRFGASLRAKAAHGVVVVFALFNVVCFIAFSFVGIGKFAARFMTQRLAPEGEAGLAGGVLNDQLWGLVFVAVTTLYVIKGGEAGEPTRPSRPTVVSRLAYVRSRGRRRRFESISSRKRRGIDRGCRGRVERHRPTTNRRRRVAALMNPATWHDRSGGDRGDAVCHHDGREPGRRRGGDVARVEPRRRARDSHARGLDESLVRRRPGARLGGDDAGGRRQGERGRHGRRLLRLLRADGGEGVLPSHGRAGAQLRHAAGGVLLFCSSV